MQVTANLKLDKKEKTQLSKILDCEESDLSTKLSGYSTAALEEYVRMILGQKIFSRGQDYSEYRVLLLIQHAFNNKIPDKQVICDHFQLTSSRSRSLLSAATSKYQYELNQAINSTLVDIMTRADLIEDGTEYRVTINNENNVELLNRELATVDGSLPQVVKKRGTVSTYVIQPSSYRTLCHQHGIEEIPDEDSDGE